MPFIIGIIIALVLICGGKVVVKKVGKVAKKAVKIIILCYVIHVLYGAYCKLVCRHQRLFDCNFLFASGCNMVYTQKIYI